MPMLTEDQIREKQRRFIAVVEKRPETALSTTKARGVVTEGLRCEFSQGEARAVMDMPAPLGGGETGETPGFYARAGICGCLAIGLKQTAIFKGLSVRRIAVDMEVDFDNSAMFGIGPNSAAPLETRVAVTIESDEPKEAIEALLADAIAADPWFLALRDAQKVVTRLTHAA
ncbi:MAG: OsmC family protein [Roseovarius sp.]